jgi:GTP-binding protein EngB required for normal cell division
MRFLFPKRKTAGQPALPEAASPGAPPELTLILKDVLGGSTASQETARPQEKEYPQAPLSQKLSVGVALEEAKRRAIESAARLAALSDGETAQAILAIAEELQGSVYRVAFAGQVKAGKSSLINVLIEEPKLLPADINPCTSVITRLHFGVPGKPQSGALFTFFSREEWRRLSLGGRTREITERLFPDFDWKALISQVTAMEENAREKLGPRFEELLGNEHSHAKLEPGLLVRYAGAAHPDAKSPSEQAEGEFAGITKSADIFFDLGAFSFPTILIDTPGVNDPFLVRDEITRQNLEGADICVVVVTARQPLSATDLNLLRTLRGLKKNRLIIFVNKTDEIKGGEGVLEEISRQVSTILNLEFPSAHIPVIFGSAAAALEALSLSMREGPATAVLWPSQQDITDKVAAEAHFAKSGLLALAVAISEQMRAGPIADAIRGATSLIEAVGRSLIRWLEVETALLSLFQNDPVQAKEQLAALVALRDGLPATFDAFSERLDTVLTGKVSLIKQHLSAALQAGVGEALTDEAIAAQASQIDAKLRIKLEIAFLGAIEDMHDLLLREVEMLQRELSRQFEAHGKYEHAVALAGPRLALTPSLAALSEPAALQLTSSLREVAARPMPAEERHAYLFTLIIAGFEPIIEKLASEASKDFQEGASKLVWQAKALTISPIGMAIGRISEAILEAETRQAASASGTFLENKAQAVRERIPNIAAILGTLDTAVPAGVVVEGPGLKPGAG